VYKERINLTGSQEMYPIHNTEQEETSRNEIWLKHVHIQMALKFVTGQKHTSLSGPRNLFLRKERETHNDPRNESL